MDYSILIWFVVIIVVASLLSKLSKAAFNIFITIACVFLAVYLCKPEWLEPLWTAFKSIGAAILQAIQNFLNTIAPDNSKFFTELLDKGIKALN